MYEVQQLQLPNLAYDLEMYLLTFDLTMKVTSQESQWLTAAEIKKSQKFRVHADRVRFVLARSTLRRILAEHLRNADPLLIDIHYDTYGKPVLNSFAAPHFNVSHSGNQAIIAISNVCQVGVDIECRQNFSESIEEINPYIFSKKEYQRHRASQSNIDKQRINKTNNLTDTYTKWVVKESVIKAIGCGLSHDMTSFSVFESNRDRGNKKYKNYQGYSIEDAPEDWNILKIVCFQNESYIAAVTLAQ